MAKNKVSASKKKRIRMFVPVGDGFAIKADMNHFAALCSAIRFYDYAMKGMDFQEKLMKAYLKVMDEEEAEAASKRKGK